jgi:acetyltransferase-like isoleucine patch superfamily enzyme
MKRLLEKLLPFIIDALWIILFITTVSISLFISRHINNSIIKYLNPYIAYSISAFLFINIYVIVCGVLFRICVPKMKAGRSAIGLTKPWLTWRMNWHFYSLVFLFLKKYVFYNRTIRFIFLRLFRVNIKYSSYFAETVDLQDANNLLTIGENSGLGSEVIVATHLALSTSIIIFKEVTIGSNSHIQARACLAPGNTIGDNTIIGFDTALSLNVSVGNDTKIGGKCIINTGAKIGNNCRIGENVYIAEKIEVPDNTVIPDSSIISCIGDLNKFGTSLRKKAVYSKEKN